MATILASSMAFLDLTAVNVALPSLQSDLHASGGQLIWVVNAYALFLSALILVGGSLGDRYGRKRVFGLGIVLFSLASTAAGLAPSVSFLIAARSFQGLGGALLVPGSLSIITASLPADTRGTAIGTWSALTTVTTIIGPIVGGLLAGAGLWRGVFFLNLPLAAGALYALDRWVPESRDHHAASLDIMGTVLITLSLSGLCLGAIESSSQFLTSWPVAASLVLGVAALIAFVRHEARFPHPLVPPSLFRSKTFSGANVVTLLVYGGLSSVLFFLPIVLIQAHNYSPRLAGLATLPFTLILAVLSRGMGSFADRFGARLPLVFGPILTGAGFYLLGAPTIAAGPAEFWSTFFPPMCAIGVGMGMTVAPLTSTVMGAVAPRQAGSASGVNNAVARTAGLLAVAILGTVALLQFKSSLLGSTTDVDLTAHQRQSLAQSARRLGDTQPPAGLLPDARAQVHADIRNALSDAFRTVVRICGIVTALSGVVALRTVEGDLLPFRRPSGTDEVK